ncbi:MAG: hypothetical protein LBB82_05340 [Treponema sp.]|jgi:glutaredoxin|nr:hypothetical protein [Treponema sp.]
MRKLTEAECRAIMEQGEGDADLTAGPAAAIILTQSWCPQWKAMKAYLAEVEAAVSGVKIYYAEYDIEDWKDLEREAFMTFKEDHFNNREIPYVRYYRNGVFAAESNYVAAEGFIARLGG